MAKKILYISSSHPVLEENDLSIFNDLNLEWFSTGIYLDPQNPDPICKRKTLNNTVDPDLKQKFLAINPLRDCNKHLNPSSKIFINEEIASKFDLIIINNFLYYLIDNWQVLKGKNVFFRTYYYSNPQQERILTQLQKEGLKIIRMFPQEQNIPEACIPNYIIPNHIDGEEFKGWEGTDPSVLTFQNDMATRMNHRDEYGNVVFNTYHIYYKIVQQTSQVVTYKLHGYNNNVPFDRGVVDHQTQKDLYKQCKVYFSLGSKPGPYTYTFLEAMATGIPTINFGKALGDYSNHPWYGGSYNVHNIIQNGVNGIISDNPQELYDSIKMLLADPVLSKQISSKGRETILNLYGRDKALINWNNFFNKEL
jgi:glycosyltransferase involved in cell wall biosynthesis